MHGHNLTRVEADVLSPSRLACCVNRKPAPLWITLHYNCYRSFHSSARPSCPAAAMSIKFGLGILTRWPLCEACIAVLFGLSVFLVSNSISLPGRRTDSDCLRMLEPWSPVMDISRFHQKSFDEMTGFYIDSVYLKKPSVEVETIWAELIPSRCRDSDYYVKQEGPRHCAYQGA